MWWCTSMRWGPVGAGVVHPDAANTPSAALPVTRRRRPMSGRPADADRGAQDAHTEPILPRLASMAVPVLSASQARIGLRGHVFKLGGRAAAAVRPRASPEVPKYAGSPWRLTSGCRVARATPAPSRASRPIYRSGFGVQASGATSRPINLGSASAEVCAPATPATLPRADFSATENCR